MKHYFLLSAFAVVFLSCNNDSNSDHSKHATSDQQASGVEEKVEQVKPTFSSLDPTVSDHIKNIFDHYIHVKTALVNSNPAEAKNGANAILDVLKKFDKSLLPTDQKSVL